jgi:hypothetical protein
MQLAHRITLVSAVVVALTSALSDRAAAATMQQSQCAMSSTITLCGVCFGDPIGACQSTIAQLDCLGDTRLGEAWCGTCNANDPATICSIWHF